MKDIEKAVANPNACKDEQGRLRVAAATTRRRRRLSTRTETLIDAGVDLVVVDTAHGHSQRVLEAVSRIKRLSNAVQVVAGNVATAEGAKALIDAGADAIKVGIGPGSICTTRIVAGVGVPQLTAIMDAVEAAKKTGHAGDRRRRHQIFRRSRQGAGRRRRRAPWSARCSPAPTRRRARSSSIRAAPTRAYRGMGSVGAMARGSADRYFQQEIKDTLKLVPEGIEGQVPYKGPVANVLHQLAGGLRAAMGYVGAKDLAEFHAEGGVHAHLGRGLARKPRARRHHHAREPELSEPGVRQR